MNDPIVSVIIPTFNRGNTLPDAVRSVLNQTWRSFEVIVVDDCSEKTASISLEEAGITDKRVRTVRQAKNQGQAAARNRGAHAARGHFLAFLDDDDFFYPDKLSHQLKFMAKGDHKLSVTDFTLPGDQHLSGFRNSNYPNDWLVLSGRFLALPSTLIIERKLYRSIGGFDQDPAIRRTEDLDFALRLYKNGHAIPVMPAFLSHYSGFHPATPEFELNALRGIETKHRDSFPPGSKAAKVFGVALNWKKTHAEMTGRPVMERVARLASLALRNPIHFTALTASITGNPLHRLFPPADRPRIGLPADKKLVLPYVPV